MNKRLSKQFYLAFAFAIALSGVAFADSQANQGADSGYSSGGSSQGADTSQRSSDMSESGTSGAGSNGMQSSKSKSGKAESQNRYGQSAKPAPNDTTSAMSDSVNKTEVPHAQINFSENQAQLSDADKADLRSMIHDAKAKGDISKVVVAVWSDKALPRQGEKLKDSDRELAASRAEAISSFLEDELKVDVEAYNMAETSHWLARNFHTSEAQLKNVFGRKGAEEAPVTNDEFRLIRDAGGPGKAVIVAEQKGMKSKNY